MARDLEDKYYKLRLGIKGQGKRGGFRVCYYYKDVVVLLLAVYSKSEQEDISIKELKGITKKEGYE